jgi:hypothetical protein
MRRTILPCMLLCAMVFVIAAGSANAGGANNGVSYVSNTGSDGHNCSSPALACATFGGALANTNIYGEIDCVNPGDYDPLGFEITQSVTIDCAGGASTSNGVEFNGSLNGTIDIDGAGIIVRLRNLSLNGNGYGGNGVDVVNAAAVYVENCVISNYNAANSPNGGFIGIHFAPSVGSSALVVSNTVISRNGYSGSSLTGGIYVLPTVGVTAKVTVDHSQINGNYFGIVGDGRSGGTIEAVISDSVVSGNTENAITAISSGTSVVFLVDGTKVTENGAAGLYAGGSNVGILASSSTIFGNAIGVDTANGGTLYSYGNNRVNGNKTNGTFTGTVSLQ